MPPVKRGIFLRLKFYYLIRHPLCTSQVLFFLFLSEYHNTCMHKMTPPKYKIAHFSVFCNLVSGNFSRNKKNGRLHIVAARVKLTELCGTPCCHKHTSCQQENLSPTPFHSSLPEPCEAVQILPSGGLSVSLTREPHGCWME